MRGRLRAFGLGTATGGCFLFFWLASFLLSWTVLPMIRLAAWRRSDVEKSRRCQDVVGRGFAFFMGAMRVTHLINFRPSGVRLDLPARPFVMIANHPTLVDVSAIMSVSPRMCCVAKTELFQSILVSRLLRCCGHIEGGQVGLMDGASVVRQALNRLGSGHSVLVFPEGTRSPARGMRRFQPGVFEIAARARVPLVLVLITCEPPTLMKGQHWYALAKTTAKYRITQMDTVYPESFGESSRETAMRVERCYRKRLGVSASVSEERLPAEGHPGITRTEPRSGKAAS
jgi:1-acyl-sn-glycerol-3-phosphate acyltransferase